MEYDLSIFSDDDLREVEQQLKELNVEKGLLVAIQEEIQRRKEESQ